MGLGNARSAKRIGLGNGIELRGRIELGIGIVTGSGIELGGGSGFDLEEISLRGLASGNAVVKSKKPIVGIVWCGACRDESQ